MEESPDEDVKKSKYLKEIEKYTEEIEKQPKNKNLTALYERGKCYLNICEYRKALEDFRACKHMKHTYEIPAHLGYCYFQIGEFENAVEHFTRALILAPSDTQEQKEIKGKLFYDRGELYFHLEEYEKSVDDFTKSLSLKGKNEEKILNFRGISYKKGGKFNQAISDFSTSIEICENGEILDKTNLGTFYFNRADCYFQMKEFQRCSDDLKKCFKLYSELKDLSECYKLQINSHMALRDYVGVLGYINELLRIETDEHTKAKFLVQEVNILRIYLGKTSQSKTICDYVIKNYIDYLDPKVLYFTRYCINESMGNWNQCLDDLNTLLKLYPNQFSLYEKRGKLHEKLGNSENAISDYSTSIKKIDEIMGRDGANYFSRQWILIHHEIRKLRGLLYFQSGKYDEAITDLFAEFQRRKSFEIDKEYDFMVDDIFNLGKKFYFLKNSVLDQRSRYLYANTVFRRILEKGLKEDISIANVYSMRGNIKRNFGRWKLAIEDYSKCISLDKNSLFAIQERCYCYAKISDWNSSIEDFQRILEVDPDFDVSYVIDAVCVSYFNIGKIEKSFFYSHKGTKKLMIPSTYSSRNVEGGYNCEELTNPSNKTPYWVILHFVLSHIAKYHLHSEKEMFYYLVEILIRLKISQIPNIYMKFIRNEIFENKNKEKIEFICRNGFLNPSNSIKIEWEDSPYFILIPKSMVRSRLKHPPSVLRLQKEIPKVLQSVVIRYFYGMVTTMEDNISLIIPFGEIFTKLRILEHLVILRGFVKVISEDRDLVKLFIKAIQLFEKVSDNLNNPDEEGMYKSIGPFLKETSIVKFEHVVCLHLFRELKLRFRKFENDEAIRTALEKCGYFSKLRDWQAQKLKDHKIFENSNLTCEERYFDLIHMYCRNLLNNQKYSDIRITSNGEESLLGNKILLILRSNYFWNFLKKNGRVDNCVIEELTTSEIGFFLDLLHKNIAVSVLLNCDSRELKLGSYLRLTSFYEKYNEFVLEIRTLREFDKRMVNLWRSKSDTFTLKIMEMGSLFRRIPKRMSGIIARRLGEISNYQISVISKLLDHGNFVDTIITKLKHDNSVLKDKVTRLNCVKRIRDVEKETSKSVKVRKIQDRIRKNC